LLVQTEFNKEKEEARFAQMWNKIITSFWEEDLIDNRYRKDLQVEYFAAFLRIRLNVIIDSNNCQICREMNLMLVPYWADRELDLIQWPPFLLASKVYLFLNYFSFLASLRRINLTYIPYRSQ
jgi:callose synthase